MKLITRKGFVVVFQPCVIKVKTYDLFIILYIDVTKRS